MPRIALIHALEESVAPSRQALALNWPEAIAFDLLDTSLAADRADAQGLSPEIMSRVKQLARYAAASHGHGGTTCGILFTCSAFGPAIDGTKPEVSIPVLRPNEAAFRLALATGTRIGLMVTFEPSAASLESELRAMAAAQEKAIEISTVTISEALAALKLGDGDLHDELAAQAAERLAADCDCIVLGQFSLARAKDRIMKGGFPKAVITTPESAVQELRNLIEIGVDK